MNKEAKYRLLNQEDLDLHDKIYQLYFCSKGVKIMKFEKILGEKKEDYFGIEFFDKTNSNFQGTDLEYVVYFNGMREEPKNIIQFEKEIKSKSESSKLYKEVLDNILKLYIEITGEKASFIDAVKYLFSLDKKPNDVIISGLLTMNTQFFGFKDKEIEFDKEEYADKEAKHILLNKKRV